MDLGLRLDAERTDQKAGEQVFQVGSGYIEMHRLPAFFSSCQSSPRAGPVLQVWVLRMGSASRRRAARPERTFGCFRFASFRQRQQRGWPLASRSMRIVRGQPEHWPSPMTSPCARPMAMALTCSKLNVEVENSVRYDSKTSHKSSPRSRVG